MSNKKQKYHYFIENIDTKEWYVSLVFPSFTFAGDQIGTMHDIASYWTKDPLRAYNLGSKEYAEHVIKSGEGILWMYEGKLLVTEHEFI